MNIRRRELLAAAGLALLAGCASAPPSAHDAPHWSGRLALTVQTEPPQSWSAAFDLQGDARQGRLQLSTPLGNTLATVTWHPDGAELIQGAQRQRYPSVEALTGQLMGTALPMAAWFDWLAGQPTAVSGWQADLSRLPQGRFTARRLPPDVEAELRVVLDP